MRSIQTRRIAAPATEVGALLDHLATHGDPLWPSPAWPPIRLDRGLAIGSRGGHGPIRYHVVEYEPGRRARFVFDPPTGIEGYHELRVEDAGPHECTLIHDGRGRMFGSMRLGWPLAVRWLHEALLRDLMDNAELAATGSLPRPSRHSRWVRTLRRVLAKRPHETHVSSWALAVFDRTDLADAWELTVARGMPTDPQVWADAIFRDPPPWVVALLRLRNELVRLIAVPRGRATAFDTIAVDGDELLLGTDDVHLDFRATIRFAAGRVTLSTVARSNNRRGRHYLAVVRVVHPVIVRSMLARAARRLAAAAGTQSRAGRPLASPFLRGRTDIESGEPSNPNSSRSLRSTNRT